MAQIDAVGRSLFQITTWSKTALNMGLFDNLFKTTPVAKVRGKLTDLSDFLAKCSLGEITHSRELERQKALVMLNEIVEIESQCSPNDRVRLDFPSKTFDLPTPIAVLAAKYWIDAVLIQRKHFTNSLAILLIDQAENESRTVSFQQEDAKGALRLSQELPNFVTFMSEASSFITNCFRVDDSATRIEYRAPITRRYQVASASIGVERN